MNGHTLKTALNSDPVRQPRRYREREVQWLFPPLFSPGRPESLVSSKVVTILHLVDVIVRISFPFNSPSLPYIDSPIS